MRLLAEAKSAVDCITRAQARDLVTVLPQVEQRDGKTVLVLPPNAGYGDVAEPFTSVAGG